MSVFRMSGSTVTKNWNIWQIQDSKGEEQLAVRLNGESQSLEFAFIGLDKKRQTVVFASLTLLFNSLWHDIILNIKKRSVTLFVDCVMIESQNISPRDAVNVDGFTSIGKLADRPVVAVPVRIFSPSLFIHHQ